jgi:pyruvate dehydrogenase E2 component (dihydrolipoamide acetyltransferase)
LATPVIMPKFGIAQEEGQIIRWFFQEGESIEEGEPLLEVMTDKVSMEVEAPTSGILRGIYAQPDEIVPVAEIIAYIVEPSEKWIPPAKSPRTVKPAPDSTPAVIKAPAEVNELISATPVAQRLAAEKGINIAHITGTGSQGRITRRDVENHIRTMEKPSTKAGKIRASPAARRVAREAGAPLEQIAGSGPKGRVQVSDVESFLKSPAVMATALTLEEQVIPLIGIRRIIAQRMTESSRTAPHIDFTIHADVTQAETLRSEVNRRLEQSNGPKVSFTALLVHIVAWVLTKHPRMNATLMEDGIHLLPEINIGVATAVDDGLIVPVIKNADRKEIAQIATDVNDLATRAQDGSLTLDEVTGGTFTISNLGMFGIETFTAILNPPETGILAVGSIVRQPVTEDGDSIAIRPLIGLTLSADHRVIDGAIGARFLSDIKDVIEEPKLMSR